MSFFLSALTLSNEKEKEVITYILLLFNKAPKIYCGGLLATFPLCVFPLNIHPVQWNSG